jgi:hypothetical protein
MAVVRCLHHKPKDRTRNYVAHVEPIGYPETALVCGGKHCSEPGYIWLDEGEKDRYDMGERIFDAFVSSSMKMKAK